MTSAADEESERQRRLVGLFIFGAFAALPYIVVRRRLRSVSADLHAVNRQLALSIRETGKLRSAVAALQEETAKQGVALRSDVKTFVAVASKERAQMGEVKDALEETKRYMGELREGKEETRKFHEGNQQANARVHQLLEDLKEAVKTLQETAGRTDQIRVERQDARFQQLWDFLKVNYHEKNR